MDISIALLGIYEQKQAGIWTRVKWLLRRVVLREKDEPQEIGLRIGIEDRGIGQEYYSRIELTSAQVRNIEQAIETAHKRFINHLIRTGKERGAK